MALRRQRGEMPADEVEVAFGLKATGEAGNFAIGKVGMAANYTVKWKWSNTGDESPGIKTPVCCRIMPNNTQQGDHPFSSLPVISPL